MNIGAGFKAWLEFVIEQVVKGFSHGGDRKTRALMAARLLSAAQSGIVKFEDLVLVAQDPLLDAPRAGCSIIRYGLLSIAIMDLPGACVFLRSV